MPRSQTTSLRDQPMIIFEQLMWIKKHNKENTLNVDKLKEVVSISLSNIRGHLYLYIPKGSP